MAAKSLAGQRLSHRLDIGPVERDVVFSLDRRVVPKPFGQGRGGIVHRSRDTLEVHPLPLDFGRLILPYGSHFRWKPFQDGRLIYQLRAHFELLESRRDASRAIERLLKFWNNAPVGQGGNRFANTMPTQRFSEILELRAKSLVLLAPRAGFEPATIRLTVECSTAELPRNRRSWVFARRSV